jgi:hypothetical protein
MLFAVAEEVGDQPHRRLRREDVGAAGDVLLEDIVLDRAAQLAASGTPCLRHGDDHRQQDGGGALIVIEMLTLSSGMPSSSVSMSASEEMATPTLPTSPQRQGMVGVVADLGGQVEGDREASLALFEQIR